MQTIEITYTELAVWTRKMADFVRYQIGDEEILPSTKIEADLQITGMDADILLEIYVKKFNVDLTGFVFEDHLIPEGGVHDMGIFTLMLVLIFQLIKPALYVLIYVVDKKMASEIFKFDIYYAVNKFWKKDLKDLYVGDLIASAILGKFTERKNVKFVLVK